MEFSYSQTENFEMEKLSSDTGYFKKTSGDQQGVSAAKGQTISKWFFQAKVSSKKWANEFYFTTMKAQHVFVRFLEEIEDTKTTFWNKLIFISSLFYVLMLWMLQSTFTLCSTVADQLVWLPIKKLAAPDGASDSTPYKYDTLRKTWFTQPLAVANVESSQNYLTAVPI